MWTGLSSFFQRLFGRGRSSDPTFVFPVDPGKLRDDFSRTQELEGPGGAVTAREAYELASEIIASFDPEARLTSIESSGSLSADGQSDGWNFVFHLPTRWGQAHFFFKMAHAGGSLTVNLTPFLARGSTLAQMEKEGQAGFVEQQWNVELERNISLPVGFIDSSEVASGFRRQHGAPLPQGGLLRAATPPLGPARWSVHESSSSKKSLYSVPIE